MHLEQWTPDSLGLLRACNTPAMTAHLGGPETDEQLATRHERYLGFWRADPQQAWPFRIMRGLEVVGSLSVWRTAVDEYEVGWAVPEEHQGQGVARAGVLLALADQVARGHRGVVRAMPSVENVASNALARSLGFTLVGTEQIEYPPGRPMLANLWESALAEGERRTHE